VYYHYHCDGDVELVDYYDFGTILFDLFDGGACDDCCCAGVGGVMPLAGGGGQGGIMVD
jgi:hypothetical protein